MKLFELSEPKGSVPPSAFFLSENLEAAIRSGFDEGPTAWKLQCAAVRGDWTNQTGQRGETTFRMNAVSEDEVRPRSWVYYARFRLDPSGNRYRSWDFDSVYFIAENKGEALAMIDADLVRFDIPPVLVSFERAGVFLPNGFPEAKA